MSNWLGQVVKNNGKNVRKKMKELAKDGYTLFFTREIRPHR
jgi:hypothetical protein